MNHSSNKDSCNANITYLKEVSTYLKKSQDFFKQCTHPTHIKYIHRYPDRADSDASDCPSKPQPPMAPSEAASGWQTLLLSAHHKRSRVLSHDALCCSLGTWRPLQLVGRRRMEKLHMFLQSVGLEQIHIISPSPFVGDNRTSWSRATVGHRGVGLCRLWPRLHSMKR